MISPIRFGSQSMNFTPKPMGVLDPNDSTQTPAATTSLSDSYDPSANNQNDSSPAASGLMPYDNPNMYSPYPPPNQKSSLIPYIIGGGAILALGAISLIGLHPNALKKFIPITDLKELNKYSSSLEKESKRLSKFTQRKIDLVFPLNDTSTPENKAETIIDSLNKILKAQKYTESNKGIDIKFNKIFSESGSRNPERSSPPTIKMTEEGWVDKNNPENKNLLAYAIRIQNTSEHTDFRFFSLNNSGLFTKVDLKDRIFGWFRKSP